MANGKGGFVILNNGIEFAATYFVKLLVLVFTGGGRFISADDWLVRKYFNDQVLILAVSCTKTHGLTTTAQTSALFSCHLRAC